MSRNIIRRWFFRHRDDVTRRCTTATWGGEAQLPACIRALFRIICDLAGDIKASRPCALKIMCGSKISRVRIDVERRKRARVTFGLIIKLSRFVGTRECADKIITRRESLRTHRRGPLGNFPLGGAYTCVHTRAPEVRTCDTEISSMGWQYWPFDPLPCKLARGYQRLLSRPAHPGSAENFIITVAIL